MEADNLEDFSRKLDKHIESVKEQKLDPPSRSIDGLIRKFCMEVFTMPTDVSDAVYPESIYELEDSVEVVVVSPYFGQTGRVELIKGFIYYVRIKCCLIPFWGDELKKK